MAVPFVGTTGRYTLILVPGLISLTSCSLYRFRAWYSNSILYLSRSSCIFFVNSVSDCARWAAHCGWVYLSSVSGMCSSHRNLGLVPRNNLCGEMPTPVADVAPVALAKNFLGVEFHAMARSPKHSCHSCFPARVWRRARWIKEFTISIQPWLRG